MPGTMVPNQMYNHECNVLKGWWHEHAIDKAAEVAAGEVIVAGSICYLDATAKFRAGLPDNTVGCFAWPNSTDYDVSADVGNTQKMVLMALPTIAAYELFTTEFDAAYNYLPNQYLTAWDSQLAGYTAAKKGKVRPGRPYHETLVGVVTEAKKKNDFGIDILSLWTYHLPIDLQITSSVV